MKPVTVVEGTMVPLPQADVDTDQIIPKQFLTRIERTGYGQFLFYDWATTEDGKPSSDFFINDPARRDAKVLVAGQNFGCGSSREHAVWALQDWGFNAVIAPSFGDIFRTNCVNVGLLPVELPHDQVATLQDIAHDPNATIRVDLEQQVVEAADYVFEFDVDPEVKERLLRGLDPIGLTLGEQEEAIAAYESSRPAWLA